MADQRFCNACGKPNREQARFCGYCGRPLQDVTPRRDNSSYGREAPEGGREAQRSPSPVQIAERAPHESYQTVGKIMKTLSFTIVMVALLGLLAYTNPTLESYESFVHQEILQESQSDDMSRALGFLFGGFASRMVASQTIRTDYIFLSTYDTNIGNEHLRALGILKNFILLETRRSSKARN